MFGFAARWYMINRVLLFSSETSFYINEGVLLDLRKSSMDAKDLQMLDAMAANRVLLLLCSDELRDSVVREFDLYRHYHIDPAAEFAEEKVLNRLNRLISIRRDQAHSNQLILEARDADRFVPAKIANRMVELVNSLSRRIMKKEIDKQVEKYQSVLASLKQQESGKRSELLSFIDSLQPVIGLLSGRNESPAESRYEAMSMLMKFQSSSEKYDNILEQFYLANSVAGDLQGEQWQTVTINKKAVPDVESGDEKAFYSMLLAIALAFFASVAGMAAYFQNKALILQLLSFRNHSPQPAAEEQA